MGTLWLDVEVLADREEELEQLFAALNEDEDREGESLPPIIVDYPPIWEDWGEAA